MKNKERMETLLYNAITLLLDKTLEDYDNLKDWFDVMQVELGCTEEELKEYGNFTEEELKECGGFEMTREMIEERIEELENEIAYEEKKMECCAYGHSDLMYLEELKEELSELEEMLDELDD